MNDFLEKLLDGAEVERLPLGDVCDLKNGFAFKSSRFKDMGEPILRIGNIQSDVIDISNLKYFSLSDYSENLESFRIKDGDILIAMSGATTGKIGKLASNKTFYLNQRVGRFEPLSERLEGNYLYHYLLSQTQKLFVLAGGGAQPNLSSSDLKKKIKIPIPCPNDPQKSLAIQNEIVRILDTFTELTAELTAELNTRKQQYQYYRDNLLTFAEDEVEWKTLGEVAEYSKTRVSYEFLDETNYVGVDNLLQNREGKTISTKVPKSGNQTEYQKNDILIGNIRPYLKKIWQADKTGGTNGDVLVIRLTDANVNSRYLYQILADDNFFEYNMRHSKGAKMPRGNKAKILQYQIPIPPLKKQAEIIAILDKFDTLTNSISEGLPKEIELRQKQYEYYREMLLNFPKPEAVEA